MDCQIHERAWFQINQNKKGGGKVKQGRHSRVTWICLRNLKKGGRDKKKTGLSKFVHILPSKEWEYYFCGKGVLKYGDMQVSTSIRLPLHKLLLVVVVLLYMFWFRRVKMILQFFSFQVPWCRMSTSKRKD